MIRRFGFGLMLVLLAVVALALRLVGLDWDQGQYLHPDERFVVWVTTDLRWPTSIGQFFNTGTSPLNPYNTQHGSFVYGTFPSFLVKAIAGLFGMDIYGELHIVGRATNAVFDTGTVLLTAWLGTRFFNQRAGLLAGILLAFTPLFLQTSHFFTVDTIATFFAVAAFACVVKSWDRSSIAWMALGGAMIGLAVASKPNLLATLAFLALPVLEQVRIGGFRSLLPRLHQRVYPALPAAITAGFVAFWSFRIAMPYAFAGPHWWNISLNQQWLDDLSFWRAVQVGLVDMKPSIQWVDRTPVVYILQNMVLWGMGPALGIVALLALGLGAWRLLRGSRWPSWWWLGIAGWCVANIALYGTGIAQNQRYLMQIYPFLVLLAAGLLIELRRFLPRAWMSHFAITAVVVYTVIFGIAFDSLYVRPITRIEASQWIYDNVPTGSVLSNEYWDDALPLPMRGEDRSGYPGMTFDLYADETQDSAKATVLVGQLSQVDYIVLSSNRVIDTVVRQPERYPVAVRYYEMLLSGELGFEPIANFTQGPEIFGIEWDDRSAEESLIVYEHPQVRIFRKTDAYNAQHVFDELTAAWGTGGVHWIPGDPTPGQMLLGDADIAANAAAADGDRFNLARTYPLVAWWTALQVLALAAFPLTWRAFRRLPDGGWMLAKGIGLLGMAAITLAIVRWGGFTFDARTVLISVLMLFALGLAVERCAWDRFAHDMRRKWRQVLVGEAIFTLTFVALALLRMHLAILPDHNLAMLAGIQRSATLPPLDPWLSGGVLHTHWAGLLPWAAIAKVLTLDPATTLALSVVGMGAVLAGVVWSLVNAVARGWVAVVAAVAVVWGSSSGFEAGIVPRIASTSVDLQTLAIVLIAAILLHTLVHRNYGRILPMIITALAAGALAVAADWAPIVTVMLVAVGLALPAWQLRNARDAWWPLVRRLAVELAGIMAVGIVIWYPAFAAHTPTQRNLLQPTAWTLSMLGDRVGIVLVLLVIVLAAGAIKVIASTLAEGAIGVIASGIAIGAVLVFAGLAWRLDSALMLTLLFSLLAVISAWHWLDTPVVLWSSALALLGTGLLMAAQARQFHATSGGESAAVQLLPVVWLLFVLAIALAAAYAASLAASVPRRALTVVSLMVTIALVIPTIAHIEQPAWGSERSSLAAPTVLLSAAELDAAAWIRTELTGLPVVLSAAGSGSGSIGSLSAVTGHPTILGDSEVQRHQRPGWEGMIESRRLDVTTIYTQMAQWGIVSPLLQQYDVEYIVVGPAERAMYGEQVDQVAITATANGNLELVYQQGGVSIYHVIEQPD